MACSRTLPRRDDFMNCAGLKLLWRWRVMSQTAAPEKPSSLAQRCSKREMKAARVDHVEAQGRATSQSRTDVIQRTDVVVQTVGASPSRSFESDSTHFGAKQIVRAILNVVGCEPKCRESNVVVASSAVLVVALTGGSSGRWRAGSIFELCKSQTSSASFSWIAERQRR